MMRWDSHIARIGGKRNAYKILVGNPEGKTAPGRPSHKWDYSNKTDLK
jgi:hypothetical protein